MKKEEVEMTTKHERELEAKREARQEARHEKEMEHEREEKANAATLITHAELSAALMELVRIAEEAGRRDDPAVVAGRNLLDRLKA
jgi:hypothetical protein